jgi:Arc/MetJ-type ribon-helix-helix transcriptional regulator
MGYPFPPDIQERIGKQMASSAYRSEDELLRDALQALDEVQEDVVAVQEAIAQWRAGDEGDALDEVFDALRRKPLR